MNLVKVFKLHLGIFIVTNLTLVLINLHYTPDVIWFYYPALGWGSWVGVSYLGLVRWPKRKKVMWDLEFHVAIFVPIIVMLILTNIQFSPSNPWAIYPLVGWGGIVFVHYWVRRPESAEGDHEKE